MWDTFGKFKKNPRASFFTKSQKNSILTIFCLILVENRIFRENRDFSEKSGRAIFLVFFALNIPENFGKILRADSEIIRYGRTDGMT